MRLLPMALLAIAAAITTARAQSDYAAEYVIGLYEPQTQYAHMQATFRETPGDPWGEILEVHLPTWRPGKYEILDMAGTMRDFTATSGTGRPLRIQKTAKSTWSVGLAGAKEVTIGYKMYANSLGDRTRHIDDSHAFLSGSSVFLFTVGTRDKPCLIHVEAPERWRTATGLEPADGVEGAFVAPNYDILVDSPFEIGEHDLIEFDIDGKAHEIVIWGNADYDEEELKEDFTKIVREQASIFGEMPYDRYVFLVHVAPGIGGGTEHYNSTIMQTRPSSFESERSYRGFLGLVSHEMFHTWNVKRLRPAGIQPYDYLRENYTKLLWVAEGTTSYYDDLTLARTGQMKTSDYLNRLASSIDSIAKSPGAKVQSLEESSFDAWVKFNKSTPDSPNTTVNFYSKGALVSLLLDLRLRKLTENRVSLDDVMRELYESYPLGGPGFTPEDLQSILERRTGTSFEDFFARYVRGTDELPMAEAFVAAGLELKPDEDAEVEPYVGFSVRGGDVATVSRVSADGPAYAAGLNVGDEIVAFNGKRLRGGDLNERLEDVEPGDSVALLLFRRDKLREISFEAGGRSEGRLELSRVDEPTDLQKAVYESWLKQEWPSGGGSDNEEDDQEGRIAAMLDDWHKAASEADMERYFGHIHETGVFLGSDDWERWAYEDFHEFAKPHFEAGTGWTFRPKDRHIALSPDGKTAWFDEQLDSDHMGLCRGTGVVIREGDEWLITHYSLTVPIPNEILGGVIEQVREFDAREAEGRGEPPSGAGGG
jgi:predicted metalloprotease with PDZ domain